MIILKYHDDENNNELHSVMCYVLRTCVIQFSQFSIVLLKN